MAESLHVTEPNLSFHVRGRGERGVLVGVRFAQESSPPGAPEDVRYGEGHPVELWTSSADILAAADDWDDELADHPIR